MKIFAFFVLCCVAMVSSKAIKGKSAPVAPAPAPTPATVTEGDVIPGWDQGWEMIMNLATNIESMLPKDDKNKPIVDAPDMVNKLKTNSHQMAVKINEFASKMQEEAKNMQGSVSTMMKQSAEKLTDVSKQMMTPEIQKQATDVRTKLNESIQLVAEEAKKLGVAMNTQAEQVQTEFMKLSKSTLDSALKVAQEMSKDIGKKH